MTSGLFPEFALLVTNLYAPAGTQIPMAQASAPLGWTTVSITDTSLRYNNGSGGTSGGSTAWSAWNFGGTFGVNSFVISGSQLPTHNHVINISDPGHGHGVTDPGHGHGVSDPTHGHGVSDPGHHHTPSQGGVFWTNAANQFIAQGSGPASAFGDGNTTNNATSIGINGSGTGISINGSGTGVSVNGAGTGITSSSNNAGSSTAVSPTYTTPQVKYMDHILALKS